MLTWLDGLCAQIIYSPQTGGHTSVRNNLRSYSGVGPTETNRPYLSKPIQLHYLVPGADEVFEEFFLGIAAGVNFREGTEFGVGTEDEVDP